MNISKNAIATGLISLLLATLLAQAAAPQPRPDLNPGLLYWQALSVLPESDEAMNKALHCEGWPKGKLGVGEIAVAQRFDPAFKLIRRAARMRASCDWGSDPSDGPHMVMPDLTKLRRIVHAVRLRVRIALDEGRQSDAREELLAVLGMVRHSAVKGALVQVMFQVGAESALLEFVADNFDRFRTQTLQELVAGILAAPPQVTVAQGVENERVLFHEWMLARFEGFRQARPRDEAKALAQCRALLQELFGLEEEMDRMIRAAGGTSAGLVRYVQELSWVYDEMTALANAPWTQLKKQIAQFDNAVETNANPLARRVAPYTPKARRTELKHLSRLAMLPAATAYRAEGRPGLERVADPFGDGPFRFKIMKLDNGREGFELRSALTALEPEAAIVFVQ